jgi:hypothetical protein
MRQIKQPIIFLRVAWMDKYQGVNDKDIPKGAGSYVTEHEDGGEVYNFKKINGNYYGYARVQKGRNINLSNLGAPKGSTEIKGVTVIFFATNPILKSQYIVGWYKNATLYNNLFPKPLSNRGNWQQYLTKCKVDDGFLLEIGKRNWEVIGPGQTNIWYPQKYLTKNELKELHRYIENPNDTFPNKPPNRKGGRGWNVDAEQRKKIEIAAMDAIADYFEKRNFQIIDVHKQNKGWDLEAKKGNKVFLLEVKGTQSDFNTIELTHNEYLNIKNKSKSFRLCVVSYALENTKQHISIFYYDNNNWVNELKQVIKIKEIVSARVSLKY